MENIIILIIFGWIGWAIIVHLHAFLTGCNAGLGGKIKPASPPSPTEQEQLAIDEAWDERFMDMDYELRDGRWKARFTDFVDERLQSSVYWFGWVFEDGPYAGRKVWHVVDCKKHNGDLPWYESDARTSYEKLHLMAGDVCYEKTFEDLYGTMAVIEVKSRAFGRWDVKVMGLDSPTGFKDELPRDCTCIG